MDYTEDAEIQLRAFDLWSRAGFPEGQEDLYYQRAVTEHNRAKAIALRALEARADIRKQANARLLEISPENQAKASK